MTTELLDIEPHELKFFFELKKQSSCLVQLTNKSDQYVALKLPCKLSAHCHLMCSANTLEQPKMILNLTCLQKLMGKLIEEKKLRVVLTSPPSSPILLPVNGETKQDPPDEIHLQRDGVLPKRIIHKLMEQLMMKSVEPSSPELCSAQPGE